MLTSARRARLWSLGALTLLAAAGAWAQDEGVAAVAADAVAAVEEVVEEVSPLGIGAGPGMLWTVIAGAMVFFMQGGFAAVCAGFTRAKNVCNILMKNLMDFSVGSLVFFFVGFAFMFGVSSNGWIGTSMFGLTGITDADKPGLYTFWFFQSVFAATACTIVAGAVAERTKFIGYLCYSIGITVIIYPIFGKWAWGSLLMDDGAGWLEGRGFYDFAGSTVVHSIGGWSALFAAWIVGPRVGKYVDGKPRAILGHSMPLAAVGTFILWFGWFGFNAGSTTDGNADTLGLICANTSLAGAAGAVAAMITSWVMFKKPDTGMSLNGALAGLVSITAGCDALVPGTAIMAGLVGGVLVVLAVIFIDRTLKIDDPVGAISVHGVCGVWGTLAVAVFSDAATFSAQLTGVVVAFVWVAITSSILFFALRTAGLLRASDEDQAQGLDISEHGNEGYPIMAWGEGGGIGAR
jgi:Amt family ammonium transporter